MNYQAELDKLNENQREAVLDDSAACIVNANVGSGKTTVLISKIIYLHYAKAVPYEKMVVLTFTNKAANEIKERLLTLEENLEVESLKYFGTFHSVALYFLKECLPVDTLGYTKEFQVIEPEEELELAQRLITEHKLKIKYKNRLRKRLETESVPRYQDDLPLLREKLKAEKVREDVMSFSDLLTSAVTLLSRDNSDKSVKNTSEKLEWIIIDEVQDSDNQQLEFIHMLKDNHTRLFAVGDPNQVIYSWRGSAFNVFYNLKARYDARELTLPINYRSSISILEAARYFLQNGRELTASRGQGQKIMIKEHYDPFSEAIYLADKVSELHAQGVEYKEIGIFYRLQNQSEILEQVFLNNEIPCEVPKKKAPVIYGVDYQPEALEAECDTVKLMTLHASKGLEFSYVFIIGVNNGLIPLAGNRYEGEEEERRLFFVGMTRAKDYLELSFYTNPVTPGTFPGPGRFLQMIPDELKQDEGKKQEKIDLHELKKMVLAERQNKSEPQKTEQESLGKEKIEQKKTVQQIEHAKYGIGTVVEEDDVMITVEFPGYGSKEFMKGFCDLKWFSITPVEK
ncbi:MAG: ATP-dependent helicase [Lachnospiraceae bacterium]|nr:ATP-dependent helicase [Lachnospiraceae bacterium]MDD3616918.1 ATP-dependent helicase [Lachnospiraceae bacterium]